MNVTNTWTYSKDIKTYQGRLQTHEHTAMTNRHTKERYKHMNIQQWHKYIPRNVTNTCNLNKRCCKILNHCKECWWLVNDVLFVIYLCQRFRKIDGPLSVLFKIIINIITCVFVVYRPKIPDWSTVENKTKKRATNQLCPDLIPGVT